MVPTMDSRVKVASRAVGLTETLGWLVYHSISRSGIDWQSTKFYLICTVKEF